MGLKATFSSEPNIKLMTERLIMLSNRTSLPITQKKNSPKKAG